MTASVDALPSTRRPGTRTGVFVDIAVLFAGRIGGILVTLLFIPRYHALLGGNTFGAVSIVLSLQGFFLVSDLGLATLISRDTAIARGDGNALTHVVWMRRRAEALIAAIALGIAAVGLAWPLLSQVSGGRLPGWSIASGINIAMIAPLIMALVATNIVQLSLNALGAYQSSATTAVVGAIARAGATVAVLTVFPTLSAFLVAQLVFALIHLFAVRWYLERRCAPVRWSERLFERGPLADLLRRCIPLTVYTLASAAAINLDKSIVSAFISLETAGSYFLATTYALVPVAILSGPLNSYFAPRVAHARHAGDGEDEDRLAILFQTVLMCTVIGPSLSLGVQAGDWLALWLHDGSGLDRVSAVAPILLAGGALSATGYYPTTRLIAGGDNGYLARMSFGCGIAVLISASLFASRGDLIGIAWSYFFFYAAGFAGLWLRLGHFTGWRWLARFLMESYILPTFVIAGTYFIAFAATRGASWDVAFVAPTAATAFASLIVLAALFIRIRRSNRSAAIQESTP
jgi:O-antigen/teichoic acid export membrane protein